MWQAVKLWASKVWAVLKPSVMVWLTALGQELLALALEIVTELASTDLSNSEKREAAFDEIKDRLGDKAEEVGSSLINLAIEIAVQKLKGV